MSVTRLLPLPLTLALALLGCAGAEQAPAAGTGRVGGKVRLVPRSDVKTGRPSDGAYADPRLKDVEFVDYLRPGFCVVLAPSARGEAGQVTVSVKGGSSLRFSPEAAAVGKGGKVVVTNGDERPHVVSSPTGDLLKQLAPGESLEVAATAAGPLELFLLDGDEAKALVYVAEGAFVVPGDDGSWELSGLAPGATSVQAWHPRFPGVTKQATVVAGQRAELDLDLSVATIGGK